MRYEQDLDACLLVGYIDSRLGFGEGKKKSRFKELMSIHIETYGQMSLLKVAPSKGQAVSGVTGSIRI